MTFSRSVPTLLTIAVASLAGCGSPDDGSSGSVGEEGPPASERPAGLSAEGDDLVFRTAEFGLEAGEEKFLCYATTAEEDLVIDRFDYTSNPVVHHFLLSRANAPEPEGLSECDVLFRYSWEPLFGAGATTVSLDIPEGAGQTVAAGTQVVIQLHLLNASAEPVTASAEVAMHRSAESDVVPVGLYAVGKPDLSLPPNQASTVTSECTVEEDVEVFALIPHMHYLGERIRLLAGPSPDEVERVFVRDPYIFDDQSFEKTTLTLSAGSTARVECDFENTFDHAVTFGESSHNEMCFAIGMATGFAGIRGCMPEDAAAAISAEAAAAAP